MRVTFNSFRDDSLKQINREATNQARLQQQISSGQKISRIDEDPMLAQKILSLQSSSAQQQQYFQNAGFALDISKSTYGAVDELRKVSDRIGEIASGTSALTTPEGYKAYATEVDTLIEQAVSAANQKYDGKFLLGGTKSDSAPFSVTRDADGKITGSSFVGAAQGPSFQVSENSRVAPFADGSTGAEISQFINRLVTMRDSMENGDPAAVSAQRGDLQASEDAILGSLGKIGAQQRRLEISQETASSRFDDSTARISTYNDTDLSQAIVELTRSQTAYQAALQTTAKIMSQSLLDYV